MASPHLRRCVNAPSVGGVLRVAARVPPDIAANARAIDGEYESSSSVAEADDVL
jgi:hypothetical protein